MINKKGLITRDWVLAGLLFGGLFALGILIIAGYATETNTPGIVNPTIEGHYKSLDNNLNNINSSLNSISQPGGLSLAGTLSVFFSATTSVMNIVLSSLALLPSLFVNFAADFGIPASVANVFFLILVGGLTTLVIFAIINASKLAGRV